MVEFSTTTTVESKTTRRRWKLQRVDDKGCGMTTATWVAALFGWMAVSAILGVLLNQKWNQTDKTPEQGQSRMSDMGFLGIFWLLGSVAIIATCTGIECQ